jgi:hypothetical protein
LAGSLILFLILVVPFGVSLMQTVAQVQVGFVTPIDLVLINPGDARRVARYVNENSGPDDLVIASPALAWTLDNNVADFQMAVAAQGKPTEHLPGDIPTDRFAFDARYTRAKFVVVDGIWRNWAAVNMPEVAQMLRQVEAWPLVLKEGDISVFRNPGE